MTCACLMTYIKERGSNEPECKIARVISMRNQAKSTTEYKWPVSLQVERFPSLHLYEEDCGRYRYNPTRTEDFLLSRVIMKVKLTVQDDGKFLLDSKDEKSLKEFITNISRKNPKKTKSDKACIYKKQLLTSASSEGRVVIPVESGETIYGSQTDGIRRSARARKVVLFEAD